MTLIGSGIIAALKAHTFSFANLTVLDAYSVSTPTFPMLTLDEIPSNDGAYIDGHPCVVRNSFTLEAYAKNMAVNGVPRSKRDAAMILIQEADQFLNDTYGITLTGNILAAPYSDPTVFRAVANYTAYIDTRTNTILRGL